MICICLQLVNFVHTFVDWLRLCVLCTFGVCICFLKSWGVHFAWLLHLHVFEAELVAMQWWNADSSHARNLHIIIALRLLLHVFEAAYIIQALQCHVFIHQTIFLLFTCECKYSLSPCFTWTTVFKSQCWKSGKYVRVCHCVSGFTLRSCVCVNLYCVIVCVFSPWLFCKSSLCKSRPRRKKIKPLVYFFIFVVRGVGLCS